MAAMEARPWFAASGALALHALAVAAALSIAGTQALREFVRPVQVALIEPEKPKPAPEPPKPEPPKVEPPKPLPVEPAVVRRPPPRRPVPPRPAPPRRAEPPPEPAAPVVAAVPIEAPRPAAITAAPAPATAAVAPRVTEGVRAPPPGAAAPSPAPASRTAPRFDASWAGNSPPAYPAMARRLGEEGEVQLDVQVGPEGNVLEFRLMKSSGSALLDQTAIQTVRKWRFSPATVDGKPVAEWYYNWKWVFKLES